MDKYTADLCTAMKTIFITGGTGYIGTRLIRLLLSRGCRVIAFVRRGSENKVPPGAEIVVGDPFNPGDLLPNISRDGVFVQLLGVPHPSPKKRDLFYQIDLPSVKASAEAAAKAGAAHFVYVSVAQEPSGIMKDYQAVRAEGERIILEKGLPCTFIRPWYVVGPGHWWPVLLWPLYKILEWIPVTRRKARALGLVTIRQMLYALVMAIEQPERTQQVLDVQLIRNSVIEPEA